MIYLDHAATTSVCPQAVAEMKKCLEIYYGNPSGAYEFAQQCKEKIEIARKQVAKSINASEDEIYFTSGGTESDNWALFGTVRACRYKGRRGRHIITSCIEHHAILNSCKALEKQGYRVTYLPVDERGIISLRELERAIRNDTILISIMYANNEIGTIQPIDEIAQIAKKYNIYFHTDAVQAYMHVPIDVKKSGIHMMSVSSHKLCGPKGTGFLYIADGCDIEKFIYGGKQERDMRAGTENVPGIAGLGKAAELIYENHEEKIAHIREIKDHFIKRVMEEIPDVKDNSGDAPHVASISFLGVRSEVLLHALEEREIYVSAGSACSSNKPEVSGTLKGIGLTKEYYESTLRFSFSIFNTVEEADICVEALKELLPMLRRFTRR